MPSYDTRKVIKRLKKEGWEILEGRGKGSHYYAIKDGYPPFPIPTSNKTIAIGTINRIERIVGFKF